jgi:UDP-GlcNAc:undecaprenyl-phosphate GlcNAc-1-phosphate transferase
MIFPVIFTLSLLISLLLTPLAEKLALRYNCLDAPDKRKVHTRPTPRWGGLAIALSVIIAIPLICCSYKMQNIELSRHLQMNLIGLATGGFLIMLLGMIDDRFQISPLCKLFGQIAVAIILIKSGIAITFVTLPAKGLVYLPAWLSWGLTMFWIVGITNALNLLDGLDGLLAGVSAIFGVVFFTVSFFSGQYLVALLMLSIAGAALGFLKYNFNPARIFMGDTGSLFLGLMFSSLSVMGAIKVTTTLSFIIPIIVLGLPIFDTSFAIVRRFLSKRHIFMPDKGHIHHRLLASGLTVRQSVLILYALCGLNGIFGLALLYFTR